MYIHLLLNHVILQLLLQNKVQTKGVIRPLQPEIYIPGVLRSFHVFMHVLVEFYHNVQQY